MTFLTPYADFVGWLLVIFGALAAELWLITGDILRRSRALHDRAQQVGQAGRVNFHMQKDA